MVSKKNLWAGHESAQTNRQSDCYLPPEIHSRGYNKLHDSVYIDSVYIKHR